VLQGGLEEEREIEIAWAIERTAAPGEARLPQADDAAAVP
jgi:hypothetical protein